MSTEINFPGKCNVIHLFNSFSWSLESWLKKRKERIHRQLKWTIDKKPHNTRKCYFGIHWIDFPLFSNCNLVCFQFKILNWVFRRLFPKVTTSRYHLEGFGLLRLAGCCFQVTVLYIYMFCSVTLSLPCFPSFRLVPPNPFISFFFWFGFPHNHHAQIEMYMSEWSGVEWSEKLAVAALNYYYV